MGGGFDASLRTVEDGISESKASAGDSHLRGEDFDAAGDSYLGGEDYDNRLVDICRQDLKCKPRTDASLLTIEDCIFEVKLKFLIRHPTHPRIPIKSKDMIKFLRNTY